MTTVKIQLDYLSGPICKNFFDPKTKTNCTDVKVIDEDRILAGIDREIRDMYASYYEFNTHGVACWFNQEKEKQGKEKMLALLAKLNARLGEINDGSFTVEDLETPRLKAL